MTRTRAVVGGRWEGAGGYLRAFPGRFGAPPRLAIGYSPTQVTITAEQVRVRSRWTGETWALDRSEVELVGRTDTGFGPWRYGSKSRRPRSVVFLLVGGGTWRIFVRPVGLQDVLAELGWPVDPGAVLTWANVVEAAVPSDPAVPSRFAPKEPVSPPPP